MAFPDDTEAQIRENANPQSYQRGADYARQGAVVSLVLRGNTLEAEVEGSGPEPYQVSVSFSNGEFKATICDCEYDYDGWCKHIVAALLTALRSPEAIDERTPTAELLTNRTLEELHDLLRTLTEKHPKIADDIEKWARKKRQSRPAETAAVGAPDAATIDPKPYQKQMKTILRNAIQQVEEYYSEEEPLEQIADAVSEMLDEAQDYLNAGEARNAAVILEAISDGIAGEMEEIAEISEGHSEIFSDLGGAWVETMLVGKWSPNEKANWTKRLSNWSRKFSDWSEDLKFEAASIALAQGWDFPPLVAILSGERRDWLALADGEEEAAVLLAETRVTILRRENRLTEAANLARTAGLHPVYAEILIESGRFREAAEHTSEKITYAADLLKIALLLADKGAKAEAIAVGTQGLVADKPPTDGYTGFNGNSAVNVKIAEWLLDYAQENGEPEIALKAGLSFVLAAPSLTAWKKLAALAGAKWNDLKPELLAELLTRGGYNVDGKADIFLQEGLYTEALSLAKKTNDYRLIGRVADAALPHLSQEILEISREHVEELMDRAKTSYYGEAAQWLRRAKTAYMALHADAEWQAYILGIKSKHRQKRSFMPLIADL